MRVLFWLLFCALAAVRVPSLAQPAGADQGLYAYVGQRILAGEVPYRDAWDQKPPAIHYTYAAMYALWPGDSDAVVATTDLIVAAATALLLLALGRRLGHSFTNTLEGGSWCGGIAALLFLLYTNPALTRLGGVRIRGQCEVFIALAVTAAFLLVLRACRAAAERGRVPASPVLAAGALFGVAFLYKYNAGAYLIVGMLALVLWRDDDGDPEPFFSRVREALGPVFTLIAGFALIVGAAAALFHLAGAFDDLYGATIGYNMFYSGETYSSPLHMISYLLTFPILHARLDALWFLGGLGCVVLLIAGWHTPARWVIPMWVAAACLSIAVNGSRGLPQYFLQAGPPMALAAGWGAVLVWHRTTPIARIVLVALLAFGAARVTSFDKAIDYTAYDLRAWTGALTRDRYLSRFGERASGDKYSALAIHELAQHLRAKVPAERRVLLFGFSPGALVQSQRASATRFFWSRPVIVGFNEGTAGYGVSGLLDELDRHQPIEVILQQHDWDPDGPDSSTYFLEQPRLANWLRTHYDPAGALGNFLIYRKAR
jgi:4-amino-4-deoxy-L-arabinose transferase-like glycosyltransferase